MTDEYEIPNEPTLEERYATLQAQADALGCDLTITLVIGGIDVGEAYRRIRTIPDEVETIAGQLDVLERLIADPRTQTAAQAANRMSLTEAYAKEIVNKAKERAEEYRVALAAFDQISSDPPADGSQEIFIADTIRLIRDENTADILVDFALAQINENKIKRREAAVAKHEEGTKE